jgi:hypothetical protein
MNSTLDNQNFAEDIIQMPETINTNQPLTTTIEDTDMITDEKHQLENSSPIVIRK